MREILKKSKLWLYCRFEILIKLLSLINFITSIVIVSHIINSKFNPVVNFPPKTNKCFFIVIEIIWDKKLTLSRATSLVSRSFSCLSHFNSLIALSFLSRRDDPPLPSVVVVVAAAAAAATVAGLLAGTFDAFWAYVCCCWWDDDESKSAVAWTKFSLLAVEKDDDDTDDLEAVDDADSLLVSCCCCCFDSPPPLCCCCCSRCWSDSVSSNIHLSLRSRRRLFETSFHYITNLHIRYKIKIKF